MTVDPPSLPQQPVLPAFLRVATPVEWDPGAPHASEGSDDGQSQRPLTPERRLLCMIVRQLTEELLRSTGLESDQDPGRRATSHVRQVAMYVCHVAYSMPMGEVAEAFGRDRSTVGHACRMVEDRRDDRAYDTFVAIVERMASAVHLLAGRRI
ncbi:helix-turn-helix domain-containing protein [Rhizobium sp. WL3]|uniref:helix-turn-helix domain-containing protein n=1 Tax=Rhizobium sp. WL3 TaxID=2603277 RepID=UPI001FEF3592|nr:helix-turn-helix domain-containing protein [Rhizobium sp. WL3]